ncbi:MAG TPA: 1,4-alpha-glucan branching protein GlgB [Ohtaekwangia sp.]|uniref:1,4-alpha-glucan branching protein GlgB n=1 Tax=Ohtaekwangia sp. TaxID=2066019 RepID=UPI002F932E78
MAKKTKQVDNSAFSLLTEYDIHLFKSGKHFKLYEKLGAHVVTNGDTEGTYFAVWAPNARAVSVIGNFNHWKDNVHRLNPRWDHSGIWEGFFPEIQHGEVYKYAIHSNTGEFLEKADPFGAYFETPPRTASIVWKPKYDWKDDAWLKERKQRIGKAQPYSVYEVHMGSWRRKAEENNRSLNYPELAQELVAYVKDMGFTHVEFLPVMEHPFYGSWGYQITGYFAPTSRYGSPEDFMYLVDSFHKAGIGVILDWVPSHFPGDAHGLYKFDGTFLYEHEDPRKGFHPDWKSYIFNYGRNEVRSFLISNAIFWLDRYHIDGLRVDAVASMLYLDYSRQAGEWIPNQYGGNENIEAITFLKEMNEVVYGNYPDAITIAEESTSWTGVSRPTYLGGLGFGQKWMMGWMHDTLHYFKEDSIHRKYHQNEITFSIMYAFTENFMLPLSHDEVVHGKGSLLGRMPGDEWKKFANLRLLFTYMYTHPGTKLLFMGGEFGQSTEWNHEKSLDWHLLQYDVHSGAQKLLRDLNAFYKEEPALYLHAFEQKGFRWIDYGDRDNSVIAYQRMADRPEDMLVIVCNFTPEVRYHYRIGVPYRGQWKEVFNSDAKQYHGSDVINSGVIATSPVKYHGQDYSISLTLPPLAVSILKLDRALREFELENIGT